jgi:hypothetical protein
LNFNIFRCRICGRRGMAEEQDLHECRPLKNYKIIGNILQVFDGKLWYPLKLEEAYPTFFDSENFRRRLDRT